MLKDITQAGLQLPRRWFSAKGLCTFAGQHGITTTYQDHQLKEPGWVNQPKGMPQVLCKRGFIDPSKNYTKEGPKEANGKCDVSLSLVNLMSQCPDFNNELTASEEHTIPGVTCQALYSPLFMDNFHHFLILSTFLFMYLTEIA